MKFRVSGAEIEGDMKTRNSVFMLTVGYKIPF